MGSFSIWHWLILLIYLVIIVLPLWRIVSKAGYPGAWALLSVIPLVNLIALWVFAFARWPYQKRDS
jgi:predicted ABC-type exoprotein transport system permease subunit